MVHRLLPTLAGLLLATVVQAATYTVSPAGSDSTPCGSGPRRTIGAGIACLAGGDTLLVQAGVYDEMIWDTIPSGAPGTPTVVKSEVPRGAILRPTSTGGRPDGVGFVLFGWRDHSAHDIVFEGFVLDAINVSAPVYVVYLKATDPSYDVHDIVIANNEIKNTPNIDGSTSSDGIVPGWYTHHITVRGNTIHDIGLGARPGQDFYSYGVYWTGTDSIFECNEVYNASGFGIHMYRSDSGADRNIIRNNYIHHNDGTGILFASGGSHNQLIGNVVVRNGRSPGKNTGDAGIVLAAAGTTTAQSLVESNLVEDNAGGCIVKGSGPVLETVIRGNRCINNGRETIVVQGAQIENNSVETTTQAVSWNPASCATTTPAPTRPRLPAPRNLRLLRLH